MAAAQEKPLTAISRAELIAALDQSRRTIAADLPALGAACNPKARLMKSFGRHPARWIACSALVGLAGTQALAASTRRPHREATARRSLYLRLAPLLLFGLKSAVALARPAATRAVQKRLNRFLE